MRHWLRIGSVIAAIALAIATWNGRSSTPGGTGMPAASEPVSTAARSSGESTAASLPLEVASTLAGIAAGGPYPYARDGTEFYNRERRLPERPRGYYREYTVRTPGANDRGARRIVTGGDPPAVYYYTDDHYRTFRRIEAQDGR